MTQPLRWAAAACAALVLASCSLSSGGDEVPSRATNDSVPGLGEPAAAQTSTVLPTSTTEPRPLCPLWDDVPLTRTAASLANEAPTRSLTPTVTVDFEATDPLEFGELSLEVMERLVGRQLDYLTNPDHLAVVAEDDGNQVLRQRYEPTSRGSDVVEFVTLDLPTREEAWLSYSLFLEPGWEWVRGGKLPGLAGGTSPSGQQGGDGTDGFSARIIFRSDAVLAAYVYHPDRPERYGEDFPLCGSFDVGTWLQVTERVVMNSSPDASDGSIEVWVDGDKFLEADGLRLRTDGEFGVDVLMYSSFYGGNDESWAPSKTTYARFDNFLVGPNAAAVRFVPRSLVSTGEQAS